MAVIHPVWLFEINMDKSSMTYKFNLGQRIMLEGYVWYIEDAGQRILVDTGADINYQWNIGQLPTREIQTLESGLGKLGISPEDIDLVIITHLHPDHVALASRFTKARFLIQKDELESARHPHPIFAAYYEPKFFEGLNFEVIDGDIRIGQDVSVIKTPGHTPGGQSVCVKTDRGLAVICGLCTVRDNFEPPPSTGMQVIIPSVHISPFVAYDSLLKIKKMADIVVPLHEGQFRNVKSIP